ncbi:hypothetical protein CEG14_01230 [Bordetella genomosp. 1]|uniref:Uncharacterized protein n=1 Tax=Bordetella genomosp. 1 TaxID=1395607 RepID=A0A261SSQ6_9BORD|nr:hypothetical protein [Bordetella genomosp. 1]OZI40419.1 hypothetical protein CEG14_01230 [Bordetella genomosp. 1]
MARRNQENAECPAATDVTVVRKIPFVELVELLEFNRLRFDVVGSSKRSALLGVQEWQCGVCDEQASPPDGVYVCSTVEALQKAVLPPDDTQLQIDLSSKRRIKLRALKAHARGGSPRPTSLRVDVQALISKVLVPAQAPAHLFEIVKHVVVSRLWVEVARV